MIKLSESLGHPPISVLNILSYHMNCSVPKNATNVIPRRKWLNKIQAFHDNLLPSLPSSVSICFSLSLWGSDTNSSSLCSSYILTLSFLDILIQIIFSISTTPHFVYIYENSFTATSSLSPFISQLASASFCVSLYDCLFSGYSGTLSGPHWLGLCEIHYYESSFFECVCLKSEKGI